MSGQETIEAINLLKDEVDQLISRKHKEIFIERIEVLLREDLGTKRINNRTICKVLQIPPRYFAHPREVFAEILAAMRRLGMTNAEIRQRLQQHCPLLKDYKQAFNRTLQTINSETTP